MPYGASRTVLDGDDAPRARAAGQRPPRHRLLLQGLLGQLACAPAQPAQHVTCSHSLTPVRLLPRDCAAPRCPPAHAISVLNGVPPNQHKHALRCLTRDPAGSTRPDTDSTLSMTAL